MVPKWSYDYSNGNEATMKNIGNIHESTRYTIYNQNTTNHTIYNLYTFLVIKNQSSFDKSRAINDLHERHMEQVLTVARLSHYNEQLLIS